MSKQACVPTGFTSVVTHLRIMVMVIVIIIMVIVIAIVNHH